MTTENDVLPIVETLDPRNFPRDADGKQRRHLSFSQLNTYLDCGEKYRLNYVERVEREPSGPFLGGIAIHETIEESEARGWWEPPADEPEEMPDPFLAADSEAIAFFLETLHRLVRENGGAEKIRWGGRGQGEDLAWWCKQGEFMLRRYQKTRVAWHEAGWITISGGTEMRVQASLPGVDIPVVGYVDKFLMRPLDPETGETGDPAIVDWKTGQIGRANPMQFATYATLLAEGPRIFTTTGIAVFLRATEATRRVQVVHFAPIVERMAGVYADLVSGIESGRFTPNPGAFCAGCSVRQSCWYWTGTRPPEEQ